MYFSSIYADADLYGGGGGGGLIGGEIRYQANDIIALHSPHGTYQVGV